MKFSASVALFAAVLCTGSALAAEMGPAKTLTPQQQKMKDCNAQATDKKGDERKAFMSQCLKGGTVAAPAAEPAAPAKPITQQQKMKSCNINANAQKLQGDTRKTYMSTCLKGDGSVTPAPAH